MVIAATVSRVQRKVQSTTADQFARELSIICRKYGLAISGQPTLIVMEREDYAFDYDVDEYSRLIFGIRRTIPQAGHSGLR